MHPTGYVTNLVVSLFQPLILMIEKLDGIPPVEPNEVQTNVIENGFSCGIIVFCVMIIESAINLLKSNSGINPREDTVKYYRKLRVASNGADELEEIFALRDTIVHNHLWKAKVEWVAGTLKFSEAPVLLEGYGDKKLRKVLNQENGKTRLLSLNLYPNRIWRRDAYIVLQKLREVFENLMPLDKRFENMLTIPILMYKNQLTSLIGILKQIRVPEEK